MKNLLNRIALSAGILALCMIVVVNACPMHLFTPEEQAAILMQPTRDEIAAMKGDLVNGVITVEQWEMQMWNMKARLGVKRVICEAIRDSTIMSFSDKIEALFAVFPWNVRSAGNMPRIIGGAHL